MVLTQARNIDVANQDHFIVVLSKNGIVYNVYLCYGTSRTTGKYGGGAPANFSS